MRRKMMHRMYGLLIILAVLAGARTDNRYEQTSIYYTEPTTLMNSSTVNNGGLYELHGGHIVRSQRLLSRSKSPYLLREDLFVEREGKLVIEPGVEIRFGPMVGITVRGVIIAEGEAHAPILLTAAEVESQVPAIQTPPLIRLVDGPSPLTGRLQLFHRDQWRSVCTNSRNWTRADLETACRQLGYQGGQWWSWIDRQWPAKPRLLYEKPDCRGTESALTNCENWSDRQLGGGVCDYHPDLGISCSPYHDGATNAIKHWRGIRFENALHDTQLIQENTLNIRLSRSILRNIVIEYAGTGRENNITSAIHVEGVPPRMESISVLRSALTGINITAPDAPVVINNCTVQYNKGYGIYVNSSYGMAHINDCTVLENGADGIKYVHSDERPDDKLDRSGIYDLCTFPKTASQVFPITIFMEQTKYSRKKRCTQHFLTRSDRVLTMHFLQMKTDRNDNAVVEVYDGDREDRLLARVKVRNGTLPQSVTSTRENLFVKFTADPLTSAIAFVRLSAGYEKTYDLNVTGSAITGNNGRGIAAEKLRSALHIHETSVSNNKHVAGVHVSNGAMDVNITDSRIAFNQGDGINITVTGGNRNMSHSSVSSNRGYGFALWLNDSSATEYEHFDQTTVIEYSQIFRNEDIGVLVGNVTGNSYVNITGNWFNSSLETALQVESSWRKDNGLTKLRIGHNFFVENAKLGIRLSPALNLDATIEYNHFRDQSSGGILIRNPLYEEFNVLPAEIVIRHNEFYNNRGTFVVSIGLSPYSDAQKLLFTRNFLRNNRVWELFDSGGVSNVKLIPRSRVAAVIVVSSSNVEVFRNILQNHESRYEIGSHLEDQSKIINCTYNWLGSGEEKEIFERLFHRKDRYNLAKIEYLPYLLHSSNPGANTIIPNPTFVPQFVTPGTNLVGGEVDGQEELKAREYIVERDINVRPGGKLVLQPGVTLRFPPSIGMMIAGKFDARGKRPSDILFTLKEELAAIPNNRTLEGEVISRTDDMEPAPVRLLGGGTNLEGKLQVKIRNKWGTVCNYGWTILDAALVCHQLGFVLDVENWLMERSQIPNAGINEDILLSNVRCTEDDNDITKCRAERDRDFEKSCTHAHDVGVRCLEATWAGLRLGPLAQRSDLQYVTIEKAGLLDYKTNSFKPALQMDFARHSLDGVKVVNNLQDGLGVLYSDIYSADAINTVVNSEFSQNGGSGVSFKQLGMKIINSRIENNRVAGIKHNPALSAVQQREFAGWFLQAPDTTIDSPYNPIVLPETNENIELANGETKYIVTTKVTGRPVQRTINIRCATLSHVVGIQLLNPIENRSAERVILHDSQRLSGTRVSWHVKRDLSVFPVVSSSYVVILEYNSGENALGGVVMAITSLLSPAQNRDYNKGDYRGNKIVSGPIPSLFVAKTRIKGNRKGVLAYYYNRYLNEIGDHFLRKANETVQLVGCEISRNREEAVYVHSPHWNIFQSNLSEISIHINNSLITDNGKGIYQFSRDARHSNNLFHWIMRDSTIERNRGGGFEVLLPDVWQYNENFAHSLYFGNNTWRNNERFGFVVDGHFAHLNISRNHFDGNRCKTGLISVRGMEKKIRIDNNRIEGNSGAYMVEFRVDSQSEILGVIYARFYRNEIKRNTYDFVGMGPRRTFDDPSYVVGFHGIQKVRIFRNLFGENSLDYELLAGVRTARINNEVDVRENWWGTANDSLIKRRIFDFDDWNDHAVANYNPYLTSDSLDASISVSWHINREIDLDNLGGRIIENLSLYARSEPYVIRSDITVMPEATLRVYPDVVMEFAPNVGILVLGTLKAEGAAGREIVMRPMKRTDARSANFTFVTNEPNETIHLCKDGRCSKLHHEGFLEYFNKTTLQWIPMCDDRFTERNAQVACRQLGYDTLNVYVSHGRRYELHPGSLTRVWSWPEPLQCSGKERFLEDCRIGLNGQLFGRRHECPWDGKFVFLHCGGRNLNDAYDYWGGIRIANSDFEHHLHERRVHDIVTHETLGHVESVLRYINITGAGILHFEKSSAVQSIMKSPAVARVNIDRSAYHGINFISPMRTIELLFNTINNVLGNGVNILSLTGESREMDSSFTPIKDFDIPYHLFSMVDVCDTAKEIAIEERLIVYYKYDNYPVSCVKIFRSTYKVESLGFRLLRFNLYNNTGKPGRADGIVLYDGDIYNITSKKIGHLEADTPDEKKLFKTQNPSLSVRFFANGASNVHGFIAEVVILGISSVGFNRDARHNVSYSVISNCSEGAVKYASVGEANAVMTVERNRFVNNCEKLYGNFSTCESALWFDVQNTQSFYFRNNLVQRNQGGLYIRADSGSSPTSLKGWIHNNLFTENFNKPALHVEGPYQEVIIYRNYFTKNNAPYDNNIILKRVTSNMTLNYFHENLGMHLLEISGFEGVRSPTIYQTTSHNGFYKNYAVDREGRSTVVAATTGQQYVDNIFFNPDNDYEMLTANRSQELEMWRARVDARHNWWGYNETLAVAGRIRDRGDSPELLQVDYQPFHMNNKSVLNGKCPPAWDLVGDTCYIFIGAPMDFYSARDFCRSANASMPFIMGDYLELWEFARKQQERFDYSERVWVQQLERVDQCTIFTYQTIEIDYCAQPNPFICEIDPKIHIDPLSWRKDIVAVGVLGAAGVALALLTAAIALWVSKSKKRKLERLERRNSIRQSMHSLRSIGSTSGFTELAYRRKPIASTKHSTDTLNSKSLDYKRMLNGGSLDSMDKSQLNSSIEDNQSYDVYEAHNPRYSPSTSDFKDGQKYGAAQSVDNPVFDLAYRNEGFRNHSTFAARNGAASNWPSRSNVRSTPPIDEGHDPNGSSYINNASTLPLNSSMAFTDSISELKRDIEASSTTYDPVEYDSRRTYDTATLTPSQASEPVPEYASDFRPPVPPHPYHYEAESRPRSEALLETNFDTGEEKPLRSKSEVLLETNLDAFLVNEPTELTQLSATARSKSQPLETAM